MIEGERLICPLMRCKRVGCECEWWGGIHAMCLVPAAGLNQEFIIDQLTELGKLLNKGLRA